MAYGRDYSMYENRDKMQDAKNAVRGAPKLHWIVKGFIGMVIVYIIANYIALLYTKDSVYMSRIMIFVIASPLPIGLLLYCYFRDLNAFKKQFYSRYGMSVEEVKERIKSEKKRAKYGSTSEISSDKPIFKNITTEDPKPSRASCYKGRPGSLSFKEVCERREKMQPVYVAVRHCYGVIEKDTEAIALEDGTKMPFANVFFAGLYDSKEEAESAESSEEQGCPPGAIPYSKLLRMSGKFVFVDEYGSWAIVEARLGRLRFNKKIVPVNYGKSDTIDLYEASKLGVYVGPYVR